MIKKFLIHTIFIFIVSCGFQPMLKEIDNTNIQIKKIDFIGKNEINYQIKNILGLLEKPNSNGLLITISTEENTTVVNKNNSRVPTEEKLTISTKLIITDNEKNDLLTERISESARFQLSNNAVDDEAEKNNILNNLINIISQKIKFKLLVLSKNLK